MAGEIFVKDLSLFPRHVPSRFVGYPANAHAWTEAQIADFDAWFADLPEGAKVRVPNNAIAMQWVRCMNDLEHATEEAREKSDTERAAPDGEAS